MRVDGQGLAILAHDFQASQPYVVQVPPGGREVQPEAWEGKKAAGHHQRLWSQKRAALSLSTLPSWTFSLRSLQAQTTAYSGHSRQETHTWLCAL